MKEMTKAERRELQERQRAEKAARKATGGAGGSQPKKSNSSTNNNTNTTNNTPSQRASRLSFSSNQGPPHHHALSAQSSATDLGGRYHQQSPLSAMPTNSSRAGAPTNTEKEPPATLFSHLEPFKTVEQLKPDLKNEELIHPEVTSLGLKMSEFLIVGGNARCKAMLLVFKKVIMDYQTPPGTSIQWNLPTHMGKQVAFLSKMRFLASSMRFAVRELKSQISKLPIDLPDEDAKSALCDYIDEFIQAKIDLADTCIVNQMLCPDEGKLQDGDTVLTYAYSSVVLKLFLVAKEKGLNFKVIVCDGRPKCEGMVRKSDGMKEQVMSYLPPTHNNRQGAVETTC